MADSPIGRVVDHLRVTLALPDEAALSDAHLLARFIDTRDEGAFAALARRYGPLVMGVCRRVTRHREDAEDAFQATFHVLVRKAAAIKARKLLANWLYGVAHKTALKARAMAVKRRSRETQVNAMPEPAAMEQEHSQRNLLPLLDQELSRLPDKYRVPIVLCDLQGLSHKEAARRLGIAENSVSSRISRARQKLAKRLARHGPAVSSAGLAGMLAPGSATARVPIGLLAKTVKSAVLIASGRAVGGVIPPQIVALTEGVLKTMLLSKLKIGAAVIVLAALTVAGLDALAKLAIAGWRHDSPVSAEKAARAPANATFVTALHALDAQDTPKGDKKDVSKYKITGLVRTQDTGEPIAGAVIQVRTGDYDYTIPMATAKSGDDGRFSLGLPPGNVNVWRLVPPAGFWIPFKDAYEQFVLSATDPVHHKDYFVRRGLVWDFHFIRKAPLRRQYVIAKEVAGLQAMVDDAGHALLTLPAEAGKRTVNVPDGFIALEWESGFRADDVKSVSPVVGLTGGFTLVDGAGKKSTVAGSNLAQVVLDKGKPILRVTLPEPDPKNFGALIGKIVDSAGQPVVGAKVVLGFTYPKYGSGAQSDSDEHAVHTDAEGVYRIKSITHSPIGKDEFRLMLTVTKDGFAGLDTREFAFNPPANAPQKVADVRLTAGSIIRGTVVDVDGRPAAGVWVSPRKGYASRGQFTKTDDTGKFTVRDLSEGVIPLSFTYGKFYANEQLSAEASPEPVKVKLKPLPELPPAVQPAAEGQSVPERDKIQTDTLKAIHTVKVPSLLDGTIQFIGTEIKAGEKVPAESVVEVSIGGEKKKFRRLKKGDPVVEGQLLARLDDRLAQEEMRIQKIKVMGAQVDLGGAKAIAIEAESKLATSNRLFGARALPMEELRSAVLTRDKMSFDSLAKEFAAKLAEVELQKAQTIIELHEIRSYVRGTISSIKKHPGEAVKKFETILEIEIKEKKE